MLSLEKAPSMVVGNVQVFLKASFPENVVPCAIFVHKMDKLNLPLGPANHARK
jgi:hypothetical protein